MSKNGGARPGAGRKKGGHNRKTLERRARLRELDAAIGATVSPLQLARLLWEIARGTTRTVLHSETRKLVRIRDAPDPATARYLADRMGGRPAECLDIGGDPGAPVVVRIVRE